MCGITKGEREGREKKRSSPKQRRLRKTLLVGPKNVRIKSFERGASLHEERAKNESVEKN